MTRWINVVNKIDWVKMVMVNGNIHIIQMCPFQDQIMEEIQDQIMEEIQDQTAVEIILKETSLIITLTLIMI